MYWGLNNNKKTYYTIFAVCIIFNLFPVIAQSITGTLIQDGKIGLPILNIMVLIMMAVLGIELIVKKLIGKNSSEEED